MYRYQTRLLEPDTQYLCIMDFKK